MIKEALIYKKLDNKFVQCELCNHFCIIENNIDGLVFDKKGCDNNEVQWPRLQTI